MFKDKVYIVDKKQREEFQNLSSAQLEPSLVFKTTPHLEFNDVYLVSSKKEQFMVGINKDIENNGFDSVYLSIVPIKDGKMQSDCLVACINTRWDVPHSVGRYDFYTPDQVNLDVFKQGKNIFSYHSEEKPIDLNNNFEIFSWLKNLSDRDLRDKSKQKEIEQYAQMIGHFLLPTKQDQKDYKNYIEEKIDHYKRIRKIKEMRQILSQKEQKGQEEKAKKTDAKQPNTFVAKLKKIKQNYLGN